VQPPDHSFRAHRHVYWLIVRSHTQVRRPRQLSQCNAATWECRNLDLQVSTTHANRPRYNGTRTQTSRSRRALRCSTCPAQLVGASFKPSANACTSGLKRRSEPQRRTAKSEDADPYLLSVPVWFELSKAGKQRAAEGITVYGSSNSLPACRDSRKDGKVSRGRSIRSCDCGFSMKVVVFAATPEGVTSGCSTRGCTATGDRTCHGPESAGHAAFPGLPSLSLKEIVKQRPAYGLTPARIIASTPHLTHVLVTCAHASPCRHAKGITSQRRLSVA
jgi:hypothetical protein